MIKDNITFEVGKMSIEVNWNKEVTPCQKIRFKFGDIEEVIDHDELYSLLMLFGNDEQQEKLIPVKRTEMIRVERLLHVKATKNIKRGEMVTIPYRYSLNREAYEIAVRENPRSFRVIDEDKLSTPVHTPVADEKKES